MNIVLSDTSWDGKIIHYFAHIILPLAELALRLKHDALLLTNRISTWRVGTIKNVSSRRLEFTTCVVDPLTLECATYAVSVLYVLVTSIYNRWKYRSAKVCNIIVETGIVSDIQTSQGI